jgi:hypothetical protein
MKKREVKEIEKEKEKSRIERENHFKKPKKKKRQREKKKVRIAGAGQTWAAYTGAAHHQPGTQRMCTRGRGAEITSKCDSTQWNSDGDDVRDQRSAKSDQ